MSNGLMYAGTASFVHNVATDTLWQLNVFGADVSIVLHYFSLSSGDLSGNLVPNIRLIDGGLASVGVAVSEVPLHTRNSRAAAAVMESDLSTAGATNRRYQVWRWNQSRVLEFEPAPKDRIKIASGDAVTRLKLQSDAVLGGVAVTVVWEEF